MLLRSLKIKIPLNLSSFFPPWIIISGVLQLSSICFKGTFPRTSHHHPPGGFIPFVPLEWTPQFLSSLWGFTLSFWWITMSTNWLGNIWTRGKFLRPSCLTMFIVHLDGLVGSKSQVGDGYRLRILRAFPHCPVPSTALRNLNHCDP